MNNRYPRSVTFLIDRLRPGSTPGLLLTVQLMVLVGFGAAFGTVLDDVTENDELASLDPPVRGALIDAREPVLNRFFEVITWAGSAAVLWPLLLVAGYYLYRITQAWSPLIFLITGLGGAITLSTLVKLTVARPRPPSIALVEAVGYAFPSGHTTAATAGWLSLALVLSGRISRWTGRVVVVIGAVLVAALVGLSRVYLGVHEPTDVLGGWSLGGLWVVAVLVTLRVLGRHKAPP